jgi:hypothetical protein
MIIKYETKHGVNINGHEYQLNIEFKLSQVAIFAEGEEQQVMGWWIKDNTPLALDEGHYSAVLSGEEVITPHRPYPLILDVIREKEVYVNSNGIIK